MELLDFVKYLKLRMNDEINRISTVHSDTIKKTSLHIKCAESCLQELKRFVIGYNFRDLNEEITFFKTIKPDFVSQLLYYRKLSEIQIFECFHDYDTRLKFYETQMRKLEKIICKNRNFYHYLISDSTEMDHLYFIRTSNPFSDDRFTSNYDYTIARIISNDFVRSYLVNKINAPDSKQGSNNLKWTGSKTDLIELIYGLHAIKVFNDGSLDMKDLATQFESFFSVSLGNYYRVFQDIRLRKINQTKFVDNLKSALMNKMDEMDK